MHRSPVQGNALAPFHPRLPAFYFGADYNPEQWTPVFGFDDEQIWLDDIRLMKQVHVNIATVGVFSWSALQTDEQTYTFEWLDRVLELLHENGIFVCLATSTAAIPPWMAQAYPDTLPVDALRVKRGYGERANFCPTSPSFRRFARAMARHMAERYGEYPGLVLWHVGNEYFGGATDRGLPCHCERCQERFRQWLQARYKTIEELNRCWMTAFWGHIYSSWEQIQIPGPFTDRGVQCQVLDFSRFVSDMYLECYLNEAEVLREITPTIPITNNFLGTFKKIDFSSWAQHLDLISWDSYPALTTHPSETAFHHDLQRSLKGGQPFILMEQTPSQVQWMPQNPLKRPGVMRLLSYQAIAHGANAVQYFQWRQSRGSAEMYHGAIISHAGHEHTRVFLEVAELGAELHALSTNPGPDLLGARVKARAALLFSWPNWWNVEFLPGPSDQIKYIDEVLLYYRSLWNAHIAVDVVFPEADLSGYDLVIAPLLNMVSERQGQIIEEYVQNGGTFVTSYFSGVVNEHALAWQGGYPGPLRKALGIWVEEFDPLEPQMANTVVVSPGSRLPAGSYPCERWCDLLHLEGAQALAHFGADFYEGRPAVTENHFGAGRAFYVATRPAETLISALIELLSDELQLASPLSAPEKIEIIQRHGQAGTYTFALNHTSEPVEITLARPMYNLLTRTLHRQSIHLPGKDVVILTETER
jgi:beta-galactosidase